MTLSEISRKSIVLSLLRYLYRWYSRLKQRANYIYHNSQIWRLTKGFFLRVKICFKYSFLGRITETKQSTSGVLDSSRTVEYLINFLKKCRDKATCYLRTSVAIIVAKDTKKDLYFSPVNIISIIVVTAITLNLFLSIVLHKQISLWGWLMRGLFLFLGVSGLFCKTEWPTVKRSSIFLRKMRVD